jgi:hypothetical protein
MRSLLLAPAALACLALAPAATAKEKKPELAASAAAMLKCRSEANAEARLRCYDTAAARFAGEVESGGLMVVDRDGVRKTRRSLFGFDLNLPFLGGDDDGEEAPKELVGKVKSARVFGYDLWSLELEDGAGWQTTESMARLLPPRPGDTVKIRKAITGGYMLHFAGRQIRVKRVR